MTQPKLSKLDENVRRAKADLEAKHAELEQQEAEAQKLQQTFLRLNKEVEDRARQLSVADEQFEGWKQQLDAILQFVVPGWGRVAPDGVIEPLPNYLPLVIGQTAVADYPRVRRELVAKFNAAKVALDEFERKHLK